MIAERFAPFDLAHQLSRGLGCSVRVEERPPRAFWVYAHGVIDHGRICAAVWAEENLSHITPHSIARVHGSNSDGEVYVGFEVRG